MPRIHPADEQATLDLATTQRVGKRLSIPDRIFLIVTALFLLGFGLMIFILPQESFSEQENRALQTMPAITPASLADNALSQDIADFYADQFPARGFFVGLKTLSEMSQLKYENNGVLIGKDGYLIKRLEYDEDGYENIRANTEAVADFGRIMAERDIPVTLAIAPRGIDVLTSHLPDYYDTTRANAAWTLTLEAAAEAGITPEQALVQRRFTHVIEPFDLNVGERRGWSILRSYDFGYHRPYSLGYWALDYDGVLYRILELYGCTANPNEGVRQDPEEQFRRIRAFECEHPQLRGRKIVDSVADPAIWDASRGESIADTAARFGIYFYPGDHKRIPGWMQVRYRLRFDENGYPRMYFFNNCRAAIRTLPTLRFSLLSPEDLDSDGEDHVADEIRYLCMSRPLSPSLPTVANAEPWRVNPLG